MKVVCKVSVQTIVLMPPLKVYNNIIIMEIDVKAQKGTPNLLNIKMSRIVITRNTLIVAPMVRESIKNEAPVLQVKPPNLNSK